ncbi:hypothetical protein BGC31_16690 [Komagataeibacter xylinus]|nr:hypothetical protein BFX83_02415 [Komagataeibacter xylinus]RFP00752.1 hypothetical protein BGC31_16690 [Komagataeibacter xylinus]
MRAICIIFCRLTITPFKIKRNPTVRGEDDAATRMGAHSVNQLPGFFILNLIRDQLPNPDYVLFQVWINFLWKFRNGYFLSMDR